MLVNVAFCRFVAFSLRDCINLGNVQQRDLTVTHRDKYGGKVANCNIKCLGHDWVLRFFLNIRNKPCFFDKKGIRVGYPHFR